MEKKKALLIISFGSSYPDARESIRNIAAYIGDRYPDYDSFRAYTSRRIIEKLARRDGIHVETPVQALERLQQDGYTRVLCQSLHVINGIEYEMTRDEIAQCKDRFESLTLGSPLLTGIDDYAHIVDMYTDIAAQHDAILLMGHGTRHPGNAAYCMLEDYFRYRHIDNIYVATVEGFPDLGYAIRKMKQAGEKKVTLMPFMIVAGDHAKNDMAGDDEDSWKNVLTAHGFTVTVNLTSLGDYPQIAELFYRHVREAE